MTEGIEIWKAEFCHGPKDLRTNAANSKEALLEWARELERTEYGFEGENPLAPLAKAFGMEGPTGLQYGMDYHWLTIWRVK